MNKPMESRDKQWFDVKALAAAANISVGSIRYHWNNAVRRGIDLPPTPAGWIDNERATVLLNYIRQAQIAEAERRRTAPIKGQWNVQRWHGSRLPTNRLPGNRLPLPCDEKMKTVENP